MAGFFREQGLRAVAVHSGTTSAPRAKSLEELQAGHLDVICAVDVFNEGLAEVST
jgi:superfamily II DNA or RNA helicase